MFSHRGFLRETTKKHQVYFYRELAWRGLNSRKLQQPTRKPKRENFSGRVKYDSRSPASYDCIAENMADWRNLYIVMLIMPSKHYMQLWCREKCMTSVASNLFQQWIEKYSQLPTLRFAVWSTLGLLKPLVLIWAGFICELDILSHRYLLVVTLNVLVIGIPNLFWRQ